MKVFPISHFVLLIFEHHCHAERTSISISALFAQYIAIMFIRVIFSSTVGLIANLEKNSYTIKVKVTKVMIASNVIEWWGIIRYVHVSKQFWLLCLGGKSLVSI